VKAQGPHPNAEPDSTPPRPTRRGLYALVGLAGGAALGAWSLGASSSGIGHRAHRLRPPGALDEPDFLAACIRCGRCVEACPSGTLALTGLEAGLDCGTPTLEPREVPCELCAGEESLLCIDSCPSDALGPVEDLRAIRMGVAIIDRSLCFSWQGTVCRACWHACPFPDGAIQLDWRTRPEVLAEACIGCGLCVRACLTEDTSIAVVSQADFVPGQSTSTGEGAAL